MDQLGFRTMRQAMRCALYQPFLRSCRALNCANGLGWFAENVSLDGSRTYVGNGGMEYTQAELENLGAKVTL